MADPTVRDFGDPGRPSNPYDVEAQDAPSSRSPIGRGRARRGSAVSSISTGTDRNRRSVDTLFRRPTRTNTVTHYHSPTRPVWESEPGAEPGVDYTAADTDARHQNLRADVSITVVDFSDETMVQHKLENDSLAAFLDVPKQDWVTCRWINVNGLSWDVIKLLSTHYGLHRLAVEDLMNTRGRTKADWYSDHAFCKSTFFLLCSEDETLQLFQRHVLGALIKSLACCFWQMFGLRLGVSCHDKLRIRIHFFSWANHVGFSYRRWSDTDIAKSS